MIHDASQISIGERNAPKRRTPQNFARGRFSTAAEEKAGLRVEVSVSPAVQDNSRNVSPGVKPAAGKHIGKLLANLFVPKRGCEQLSPAPVSLIGDWQTRIGVQDL